MFVSTWLLFDWAASLSTSPYAFDTASCIEGSVVGISAYEEVYATSQESLVAVLSIAEAVSFLDTQSVGLTSADDFLSNDLPTSGSFTDDAFRLLDSAYASGLSQGVVLTSGMPIYLAQGAPAAILASSSLPTLLGSGSPIAVLPSISLPAVLYVTPNRRT